MSYTHFISNDCVLVRTVCKMITPLLNLKMMKSKMDLLRNTVHFYLELFDHTFRQDGSGSPPTDNTISRKH